MLESLKVQRSPKLRRTARRGHSITHASVRIPATPFFLPQKPVRPWPHRPYLCRRPCKSVVWDYFRIRVGEDDLPVPGEEQFCRSCGKVVLAKGGNTTNLINTSERPPPSATCGGNASTFQEGSRKVQRECR